jgi:hypothetical protein
MPHNVPPTIDDANLILRLYELRREDKLRAAREWFRTKFYPMSLEDLRVVIQTPGEENTNYRMVTTYWDMACSFVATGVLHADLFFQSSTEALMVWSRLETYAPRVRAELQTPWFLVNVEKAIGMVPWGQERLAIFRARLAAMREKAQKTGKAS